jgi:hypothetical protein
VTHAQNADFAPVLFGAFDIRRAEPEAILGALTARINQRHHAPHRQHGDREHDGGFGVLDHAFTWPLAVAMRAAAAARPKSEFAVC